MLKNSSHTGRLEHRLHEKPSLRLLRHPGLREKTILQIGLFVTLFFGILTVGSLISVDSLNVDLTNVFASPSLMHPFGTDWVGRDMLLRTAKGLSLSMKIGVLCTVTSSILAVVLGIAGPLLGGKVDTLVSFTIDLVLSIPHTIIIILISLACGGGAKGIVLGVMLTHWTQLTRVIRAEVLQIKEAEYAKVSKQFGKSNWYIATRHIFPHIIPQLFVGTVLIFPHAILHEASITFLGFGLPPHEPAIGVILAESMKYLTGGKWWLAFFPGLSLIGISMLADQIGSDIDKVLNPKTARL